MAFAEDLAVFINADTPGYAQATVGGTVIDALFDNPTQDASLGFSGMEARHPALICKTADVTAATHGTTVVINSVSYTVGNIHHDGHGITTFELKA